MQCYISIVTSASDQELILGIILSLFLGLCCTCLASGTFLLTEGLCKAPSCKHAAGYLCLRQEENCTAWLQVFPDKVNALESAIAHL